jgi:hypothetical protein
MILWLKRLISTPQVVVERKLKKLIQEFWDGKHEGSVMTAVTVETLVYDERQMWRATRKELEDIGISVAAFDSNTGFIPEWFQKAIESRAFEENCGHGDLESMQSGSDRFDESIYSDDSVH